jgi:hypothetical protein
MASWPPRVLIKPAAAFGEAADDVRLAALDAIQIFAAGLALQVILALRVLTSHPLVVQAESASRRFALTRCGHRHDVLPPTRGGSYRRT